MSAYVCDPSHIGLLAAYAAANDCSLQQWRDANPVITAQTVARELMAENIRSVAFRYPNDKDGERPGRQLKDATLVELAQHYAAYYLKNTFDVTSVAILSLVSCLDYQSCETDDWRETTACRQLERIQTKAIRHLPGWGDAPWEWDEHVPEIEALICL